MIKFFILILLFSSQYLYSQGNFDAQYKLIKENIKKPYEVLRNHTDIAKIYTQHNYFIDFIISKYKSSGNLYRFISNRHLLARFSDDYLLQDKVKLSYTLGSNLIYIEAFAETKSLKAFPNIDYDSTYEGPFTNPDYNFRYIKAINGIRPIGLSTDSSKVTTIKTISITFNDSIYFIDPIVFQDLFFPNFLQTYYAVKPFTAVVSPDKNFIYIYLFGGYPHNLYFSKIIFDITTKKTVGRIIAESKDLNAYNCLQSKYFIGF